jgi:hypothetical protein
LESLKNIKNPRGDISSEDDLQFILWTAEFNKGLREFWKLIKEND